MIDEDRRAALLAAKLRALVATRWTDADEARSGGFPDGSTLLDEVTSRAWILVESDVERRLGGCLAWARRAAVSELHVIVPEGEGGPILARRAGEFVHPAQIWIAKAGPVLDRAIAAPPALDPPPAPGAELYRPVLVAAGTEPVVEGGVLTGELLGLEVARVMVDDDGSARVEPGVGRFDREAGAMMFAELGDADGVARAVDIVARYRMPDAERHPLNQLVPERWLRSTIVADPALVGARFLAPVGSAMPRRNLTEQGVASALGEDHEGAPVVVVCSTGVNLDLVPAAADDRLTHAPDARLILAVPQADAMSITDELAATLRSPAEVVRIPAAWRSAPTTGS